MHSTNVTEVTKQDMLHLILDMQELNLFSIFFYQYTAIKSGLKHHSR